MADTKLSALTELAATPADDDEVYIRDVSEVASAESKRVRKGRIARAFGAGWTANKLLKGAGAGADPTEIIPGSLAATCIVVANDAKAEIKTWAGILQAAGYPVWVCDGTADDVEIQAAIGAMTGGGLISLTDGTFNLAATVTINTGGISVKGVNEARTIIKPGGAFAAITIGSAGSPNQVFLEDFSIVDPTPNTATGISLPGTGVANSPGRIHIEAITLKDLATGLSGNWIQAMWLDGCWFDNCRTKAINILNISELRVSRTAFWGAGTAKGVLIDSDKAVLAGGVTFDNCWFVDCEETALEIRDQYMIFLTDCLWDAGMVGNNIKLLRCNDLHIVNNSIGATTGTNSAIYGEDLEDFFIFFNQISTSSKAGIEIQKVGATRPARGKITGNIIGSPSQDGILIPNAIYVDIEGNIVFGIGGTNTYSGIRTGSATTNFDEGKIRGNRTYAVTSAKYSWEHLGGNACEYGNNDFKSGTTGVQSVAGIQHLALPSLFDNKPTAGSGASTGTGVQQTIAHGLSYTPTTAQIMLWDIENGASPYHSAAPDATNIYVTAVLNQDWGWATVP